MLEQRRISARKAGFLFFGTYVGAITAYFLWMVIHGDWHGFQPDLMLILEACLFPSGLFAFVDSGGDLLVVQMLFGYGVYVVVFALAFSFRKCWQMCLLWFIILLLIGFNIAGCSEMQKHALDHLRL